jgi:putative modified peptide
VASTEADVAAKLIERLLSDPAFRARFRRDPAGACREAGLDDLAQEMSLGAGKAMYTLDVRESKSSLAGVMMAAAMEGVGIYQFSENVLPHLEEIPGHIADVLSRVDLPALPNFHGASGGGGGGAAAAAVPDAATGGDGLPAGGDAVADGRQVDAAQDVADRLRDVVEMRGDVLGELHDADALHRRRHHHAGEARLGLPHVQGHHRLARAQLHLLRELLESRLPARLGGVAAEARAERRVDEQALDQLRGDVGFSGGHGHPLKRSTSGFPSTTKTGTKRASQSVPSTMCTTHDGANWDMIGS